MNDRRKEVFDLLTDAVLCGIRKHGNWTSFDAFMADRPHVVIPEVVAELAPVMQKHQVPLTQLHAVIMLWNADRSGAFNDPSTGGR